ncbi:MAG: hypothetical protein LBJ63_01405 [Prevotellaceae bacterium]|jgi:hypothetical protein|nr:hypothetical protein [Prevotellaceae bacterium]
MKKIFLILLIIALISISCEKVNIDNSPAKLYSKNFIYYYHDDVTTFYIQDLYAEKMNTEVVHYIALINLYGGHRISADSNHERFNELAEQYNDISYNNFIFGDPPPPSSLAEPILSISVVSDADYDEAHPAETLWDDMVIFCANSPYKFIESGYKDIYPGLVINGVTIHPESQYHGIYKYLTELEEEDLMLLTSKYRPMQLQFPKVLPINKEHNITVTIKFKNGKILTATKKLVFP